MHTPRSDTFCGGAHTIHNHGKRQREPQLLLFAPTAPPSSRVAARARASTIFGPRQLQSARFRRCLTGSRGMLSFPPPPPFRLLAPHLNSSGQAAPRRQSESPPATQPKQEKRHFNQLTSRCSASPSLALSPTAPRKMRGGGKQETKENRSTRCPFSSLPAPSHIVVPRLPTAAIAASQK